MDFLMVIKLVFKIVSHPFMRCNQQPEDGMNSFAGLHFSGCCRKRMTDPANMGYGEREISVYHQYTDWIIFLHHPL